MTLPEDFLASLKDVAGFDRAAFEAVHGSGEQITSIRVNPAKSGIEELGMNLSGRIPWTDYGYYLARRPSFTFDPLFHAGCYYVQEASSMFLEQAVRQYMDMGGPLKALDLCGAPGGKSTHLQSILPGNSLLVSNEVIKGRSLVLSDNIIKWGASNVIVTSSDPSAFKKLEGFFDLMVVDAPCSGSGLFRRDEEAVSEWSLNNVQLCSQRQQRILAEALPSLKENGILVYSTCSYSQAEDEDIADWLVNEMDMEALEIKTGADWNIVQTTARDTGAPGYRFYPDKLKGEGFFLSVFRKKAFANAGKFRSPKAEKASARENSILLPWLKDGELTILKEQDRFLALSSSQVEDYSMLRSVVKVVYAGTGLGQIMKERLVPEHSLALSSLIADKTAGSELSREMAVRYLQRQDIELEGVERGWQLVRYQGHNLGWVNVLPNRINNYYPKEIRILKQSGDASFEK